MARFDLTDFEWSVIQPLLPNKPRGVPRVDDRRVLNGIFWRLRTGAPWADIPERYGPHTTCVNRFNRWRRAGVWDRILNAVSKAYDGEIQMIDSSSIRVHQHAARICSAPCARAIFCSPTGPTIRMPCAKPSPHAAPGPTSNRCRDARTSPPLAHFCIATETSSSASSTSSSTTAPSPPDTTKVPTITSPPSSLPQPASGCDLMSRWPRFRIPKVLNV